MNKIINSICLWLDTESVQTDKLNDSKSINFIRCLPFIAIHIACLYAFKIEFHLQLLIVCLISYIARMFFITGFYHRFFSHRSYKTSRPMQFIFGVLGSTAVQRGPLWWSAHHRYHHAHADLKSDRHSPLQHGFLWSHCGWFIDQENFSTDKNQIRDLYKFPELVFLNRFDILSPALYAVFLYYIGGLPYFIWGFCISTVLLYHATVCINSCAHKFGKRKFNTKDHSKNSLLLAIITLGEGWHNNHHFWPSSARQGFNSREIDISYQILKFLAKLNIIWDLRLPPEETRYAK